MAFYITAGITVAAVMAAVIILWKISRWILIPVQIVLFLALIFICFKIFCEYSGTKNNIYVRKINTELIFLKYKLQKFTSGQLK